MILRLQWALFHIANPWLIYAAHKAGLRWKPSLRWERGKWQLRGAYLCGEGGQPA